MCVVSMRVVDDVGANVVGIVVVVGGYLALSVGFVNIVVDVSAADGVISNDINAVGAFILLLFVLAVVAVAVAVVVIVVGVIVVVVGVVGGVVGCCCCCCCCCWS